VTAPWRDRFAELLGARTAHVGPSYFARTTTSAVASLAIARALDIASPIWAVVSAVVVIQPELKGSVASAGLRVVANLIGAGVGVAIAALELPTMVALAIGLAGVAAACRLVGLDGAARSAGVALVIVLLRGEHEAVGSSEQRVALVLIGCLVALLVTLVFAGGQHIYRRLAERKR
jgi:uncharacterized membrane protein YgaE (UPF0421/DUF939 family)